MEAPSALASAGLKALRRALPGALLALGALAAAARPQAAAPRERPLEERVAPDPQAAKLGVLLRRIRGGGPQDEVRAALAEALPPALGAALGILADARLPLLEELEEGPPLYERQQEVLLEAIQMVGARPVLAALAAWTPGREPDEGSRAAEMLVLGAVGDLRCLSRLFELAEETAGLPRGSAAFERALTQILRRERKALASAWGHARAAGPEVFEPVLRALGASRDPRALDLLDQAMVMHPALDALAVAQVRLIPPPQQQSQGAGLAAKLRGDLDPESIQRCRAAALALGQMEDLDAVPRLVDLLEADDRGTRQAAHWALQRIARTRMPLDAARWSRWWEDESRWWLHESERLLTGLRGTDEDFARSLRELLAHPLFRDRLAEELADVLAAESGPRAVHLCRALGHLGSPRVNSTLMELFGDIEDELAVAAHGAIQAITGRKLPPEREVWRAALFPSER